MKYEDIKIDEIYRVSTDYPCDDIDSVHQDDVDLRGKTIRVIELHPKDDEYPIEAIALTPLRDYSYQGFNFNPEEIEEL